MIDILECLSASLSHADPTPRYLQIANALEQAIRQHQLTAGAFLPTERQLAENYGCRASPSAKRWRSWKKRLITRLQGVGTRVAQAFCYSLNDSGALPSKCCAMAARWTINGCCDSAKPLQPPLQPGCNCPPTPRSRNYAVCG